MFRGQSQAAKCLSAINKETLAREYVCQEADQHLQSAKKNTHGNRDNGTKQSAGINENRSRLLLVAWTKWRNSANMRQSRQRYSILAEKKRKLKRSPLLGTTSASNLYFAGLERCDAVAPN